MQAVMRASLRYLPLVLLALAWEAVARLNLVDTSALPPLSKVATAWVDLTQGGELISNGAASLYRGSIGLLLAVFGGGALGLCMARWRLFDVFVNPLVELFYPLPKSALIPVMWDVIVPSALPELLNGIRTALALAFILLVSSELIVSQQGFGYLIGYLGSTGAYEGMYAVVLTVAFLGFAADRIYQLFIQWLLQWRE